MIVAFLFGVLFTLIVLLAIFYFFCLTSTIEEVNTNGFNIRFGKKEKKEGQKKQDEHELGQPESCYWFTQLIRLVVEEMQVNELFNMIVRQKFMHSLNKDRASWISEIVIENFDMSKAAGGLSFQNVRVLDKDSDPQGRLKLAFDCMFEGSVTLRIRTSLQSMLGKFLPILVRIEIKKIHAKGLFFVPVQSNPLARLGFERDPLIQMEVKTDFGGSLSVSNLPAAGSYLEKKVMSVITKSLTITRGGGVALYIPIPYVRRALFMTMKKRRVMLEKKQEINPYRKVLIGNEEVRPEVLAKVVKTVPAKEIVLPGKEEDKPKPLHLQPQKLEEEGKKRGEEEETLTSRFTRFTEDALSLFKPSGTNSGVSMVGTSVDVVGPASHSLTSTLSQSSKVEPSHTDDDEDDDMEKLNLSEIGIIDESIIIKNEPHDNNNNNNNNDDDDDDVAVEEKITRAKEEVNSGLPPVPPRPVKPNTSSSSQSSPNVTTRKRDSLKQGLKDVKNTVLQKK